MTDLRQIRFEPLNFEGLADAPGQIALIVNEDGALRGPVGRVNRLVRGALQRALSSDAWAKIKDAEVMTLRFPAGIAAEAIHMARLPTRPTKTTARKAGAALAKAIGPAAVTLYYGRQRSAAELAFGMVVRSYDFDAHKTTKSPVPAPVVIQLANPEDAIEAFVPLQAVAEGVIWTRDLVNEPANVLTTTDFAIRLETLRDHGIEVDVIDEAQMAELGMGSLLCVGQGSEAPSKMVVMRWMGGVEGIAPLALVGKGVVFDTGGISLKPAGGMEDMTMDMGGAGVVAGTMLALARRRAAANVVGLVGLVENMPSGNATRPGDVVTSMKGDTIEVINTDAEGRLVLADVMWYAQQTYHPAA
ncbi:MAG: leucyl aminopeptidase family protein, partial [Paracoccaceae bacterium]